MNIKKLIAVFVASILLLSGCGGSSGNDLANKSDIIEADNIPPVISVIGASAVNLNVGESFIDPGAIATDPEDGDLTESIRINSNVNTAQPGSYRVLYSLDDTAGNAAQVKRRSVVVSGDYSPPVVADTIAPVITMSGATQVNLSVGDSFSDPGATALDNVDGNLTGSIRVNSNVNTAIAGSYRVLYNVDDSAGNAAQVKRRSVVVSVDNSPPVVADTVAPVITMIGASEVNLNVGANFSDPGATALDNVDGNLTGSIRVNSNVNTAIAGSYRVLYSVDDAAGNAAEVRRRSIVVSGDNSPPAVADTAAPVITLVGASSVNLNVGANFNDPGATAFDNVDGNLTGAIRVNSNVNTAIAGSYRVLYNVDDSAGNAAAVRRRDVIVSDDTSPPDDITPPTVGGIIPNSVDTIWDDMNGANLGGTSNLPSFKRFNSFVINVNNRSPSIANQHLIWFEIELEGNGSPCSSSINQATNTVVEVGRTAMWYLMNDDTWVFARETVDHVPSGGGNGSTHPHLNTQAFNSRCAGIGNNTFKNIQQANAGYNVVKSAVPGQFLRVKPDHYYRYHGWVNQHPIDHTQVKAIFGQTYMRLAVENPSLPDDRHLARYVAQLGNDSYKDGKWVTGNGVPRWKRITEDWQPFNVYSGNSTGGTGVNDVFTKAQLIANPPPFRSTP